MSCLYLHQKPTIEQLSLMLNPAELQQLFVVSRAFLRAFACERPVKTLVRAAHVQFSLKAACVNGMVDVVEFLQHYRPSEIADYCTFAEAIDVAARNGQLDVVRFLHKAGRFDVLGQLIVTASMYGHLDIVQWAHEHTITGCTTHHAMDIAAYKGHLDIVQWRHANCRGCCTTWAITYAAIHGHIDVVRWLYENRTEGYSAYFVSENGEPKCVEWLRKNKRADRGGTTLS